MNKIFLIISREYITRVRKRSFVVMTILGPLLMAAIVVVPVYMATLSNEVKTVSVIDETGLFAGRFKDSESIRFHYLISDISSAKASFSKSGDYALLYIPKTELSVPGDAILYSKNQVNLNTIAYVRTIMEKRVGELKLEAKIKDLKLPGDANLTTNDILRSIKASVSINSVKIGEQGKEEQSYPEASIIVGMFSGFLIYFFIFLFGTQVMRGVIEEKTNRIIEVIISSVKPFQLMIGKITGIGMVGLTQFLLWVVLTATIVTTAVSTFSSSGKKYTATEQIIPSGSVRMQLQNTADSSKFTMQSNEAIAAIQSIDFPVMIGMFIFFFLFGYLLYAAFFAAVGSAVDSEADTQQFMLPITLPLILAFVMSQYVIQEPNGSIAFWLSVIPLTSPVIMMVRIPFGVPYAQVILSMVLLVGGFLGATWLAAKIYRTGILMYGKKASYRELIKWLKYKN